MSVDVRLAGRVRCRQASIRIKGIPKHLPIQFVLHQRALAKSSAAAATAATAAVETSQADEQFMKLALQQARLAYDAGEVPIGAALVINSEVVAAAFNLTETKHNPLLHAEMLCISAAAEQQLAWRLQEATLYSTIEPCPMCAGAILQARLARLVYGAKQPRIGADGSWVAMFPKQQLSPQQQPQLQRQQLPGKQSEPSDTQQGQPQQAAAVLRAQPLESNADGTNQSQHAPQPFGQPQLDVQQQQLQQQQQQALQPVGPHPFHPDIQVTSGVLADECAKLMRDFFRKRRREQKAAAAAAAAQAGMAERNVEHGAESAPTLSVQLEESAAMPMASTLGQCSCNSHAQVLTVQQGQPISASSSSSAEVVVGPVNAMPASPSKDQSAATRAAELDASAWLSSSSCESDEESSVPPSLPEQCNQS